MTVKANPQPPVRLAFVRELEAAVNDRAQARKLRSQFRDGPSWRARLDKREATLRTYLDGLEARADLLIPDARELHTVRRLLGRLRATFERAGSTRHQQFDGAAHRPDDRAFYAACEAAMKRHGIGATETARLIVERIAPGMSPKARRDLIGDYTDKAEQIRHLAENIRKGCRRLARAD